MIDEKKCLAERYQIEEQIGQNAVGSTYAARDTAQNRKVIVKELISLQTADIYKVLKKCSPLDGIIDVLDVVEEGGTTYAVMECVEGVTLEDYLCKSSSKFKVNRIKDLLNPILCSLIRLYQEGVSHGNISADNFIFTNEGKLKLIGFGHVNGKISDKGKAYVPAELLDENAKASEASDIYSLSAFIYRCITGVTPQEASKRQTNDICRKPSELGVEISNNNENALLMGMSVDINQRLIKMAAFYRAFYNTPAPVPEPEKTEQPKQHSDPVPVSRLAQTKLTEDLGEDEKTEIINTAGDDEKTEIINNVQPFQAARNPLLENNVPIVTNVQPDVMIHKGTEKKKKGKKKKGNFVLIVIMVIGIVIAIALGIITFRLALDYIEFEGGEIEEGISGDTSDTADKEFDEDDGAEVSIDAMMSEGHYSDAIKAILDAGLDEDEGADNIQKAIDELYSQCINETSALADNGQYDAAFSIIDEKIQYFADIADKVGYVKDKHEYDLTEQKYQLTQAYIEYMYNTAQACANNGDESGMLEALNNAATYASTDEVEKKKVELYTSLVLVTMSGMSASGENVNSIMKYIDNNLEKAGNNCRLIEFWDYYDDLYHKQIGVDRMTVTQIRVSAAGYILPESNTRMLSYSDINSLTEYELYFALFEIYARHNRIFSDSVVSSHFRKYSWYNGTITPENFDESVLSDIEKQNINTIINYQRDMGYR